MTAFHVQQAVIVLSDISGTGIKKGDVGKVIYVQQGRHDTDRSTNLAATALQVRFRGGAEIWMTGDEIAPAADTYTLETPAQLPKNVNPLDDDGDGRRDGRQQRVIPRTRFEDGFAAGWMFGVAYALKSALDIKPSPRILSARSPCCCPRKIGQVRLSGWHG